MKILFIGDIVGQAGCEFLQRQLPGLRRFYGADMVIANGKDVSVIHKIIEGRKYGTLFVGHRDENFKIADYVENM